MIKLELILNHIRELLVDTINYVGNENVACLDVLNSNQPLSLGWIASYKQNKQKLVNESSVTYIITDDTIDLNLVKENKVVIRTKNPRLAYIKIAEKYFPEKYLNIERKIGKNCSISPTAIIKNAQIGNNCIISDYVIINDGVTIGSNTIIQSGTIIGNTGLGCERDEKGQLHKFPHYSGVKIGCNVDIGPNCQIVRGTLSPTIIGDNNKIDGLCSIGHNTVIGNHNWIASSVMIAGSVSIGNKCTIYAATSIKDQIVIGDNCIIGMGAVVTKNIPSNEMWYGCPAQKIKKL